MSRGIWKIWTPDDIATAAAIFAATIKPRDNRRSAKMTAFRLIAQKLGREIEAVRNRLTNYGPSFGSEQRRHEITPQSVLLERDKRRDAGYRRDLTAMLCGDPPVGFSALDRRPI